MNTVGVEFRELTAQEIDGVVGGWEYLTALEHWLTDVDLGLRLGEQDASGNWNFVNGGSGWGYWVNDHDLLIAGHIDLK